MAMVACKFQGGKQVIRSPKEEGGGKRPEVKFPCAANILLEKFPKTASVITWYSKIWVTFIKRADGCFIIKLMETRSHSMKIQAAFKT